MREKMISRLWKSGVFALLLAAGCGAPSSLDLCNANCDVQKRCGTLTDAQAANCHTTCEANKGQLADQDALNDKNCRNAGQVRSDLSACGGKECNKVDSCVAAVDTTCIAK